MTLEVASKKPLIVGNYRFTGKHLGRGNFARVEEAYHIILNIKVAIKIMSVNEIKEDYVVKNLYREARLMARLNHPCVTALYQTMQRSDNVYYLVTEVASGGDLCTFIKNQTKGRLDERITRIYARQFVSALSHMHSLGVVHRDLKMENVMLNSAQTQIKIVDFGLSNLYNSNEMLRTHCGSPEYAAPELFVTGKKYGPEVDLWSLGIILYGMVIGQLPFVGDNSESSQDRRRKLVAQINKGLASYHRRMLGVFSLEFQTMMGKMLATNPSRRMTVKELTVDPWITEKGKKVIQTHPVKKLDSDGRAKICSQISELTGRQYEEVVSIVKNQPLGAVGGLYNILSRKYCLSRITGDGVTKNSATNSLDLTKTHRPLTPKTAPTKSGRVNVAQRPKTVQNDPVLDYRVIKSPSLRRKVYSAGITSKVNRPVTANRVAKLPKVVQQSPEVSCDLARVSITRERLATRKSDSVRETRPVTATGNVGVKRVLKSVSRPASCSKSDYRTLNGKPVLQSSNLEKSPLAFGDLGRQSGTVSSSKKPIIYDPIARSIAGYVINTVPKKIAALSIYKK